MEWEMGKGGSQIKITVYYGTSVHLSIQYSTVRQVEGEIGRSTPGDFAVLGTVVAALARDWEELFGRTPRISESTELEPAEFRTITPKRRSLILNTSIRPYSNLASSILPLLRRPGITKAASCVHSLVVCTVQTYKSVRSRVVLQDLFPNMGRGSSMTWVCFHPAAMICTKSDL